MKESGYYPPGAEFDPAAPYNQEDIPEKEFDVTCCQTLSKTVSVLTCNYIPGASGVDYEYDGDGGCSAIGWQDSDDTSNINWEEEYHDNDYHTPLQLIELFGKVLEDNLSLGIVFKNSRFTKKLIDECKNWSEDETEIFEG